MTLPPKTSGEFFTAENFTRGMFFVEDEMIGVTEVKASAKTFFVFVTNADNLESKKLLQFPQLSEALQNANDLVQALSSQHASPARFESFGCDKGPHCKGASKGACPSCANSQTTT